MFWSNHFLRSTVSYYLERHGWGVYAGYVELLIVLEVFLLTDSMKVYGFLRGNNISELLNFILSKGNGSEEFGFLIEKSYNYGKESKGYLSYYELGKERKSLV